MEMKTAKELEKTPITLERIEKDIEHCQKQDLNQFKIFYPHFIYLADETKLKLMKLGYKVYLGNWDGIITDATIIEW